MKIRVSITREYDTEGEDHGHLFDGISDPKRLAIRLFAADMYSLADASNVADYAILEEIE